MTCRNKVRAGIINLSNEIQKELNSQLPAIFYFGDVITFDGVKLEANGCKYYDFVIYYF